MRKNLTFRWVKNFDLAALEFQRFFFAQLLSYYRYRIVMFFVRSHHPGLIIPSVMMMMMMSVINVINVILTKALRRL